MVSLRRYQLKEGGIVINGTNEQVGLQEIKKMPVASTNILKV